MKTSYVNNLMREASDYGKVGGNLFLNPNIATKEVFKERLISLMGTEYVKNLPPPLFNTQYNQYCKTEERFYKLQQQIKDQQELISILLDQLESNDPYYKNFIEEEEKVKSYIQKHPQP